MPITIDAETARHVGDPKLRLPASEKACPFNFLSLVQRTTSQGGDVVSLSTESSAKLELRDTLRLWLPWKAGEEGRGLRVLGEAIRDWKRRSKGLKEGDGLLKP